MRIKVLDAATVGRIAAGEVVERPSSVVKELVENSLDACSTSITVEIRDGGISYLRVTDNGSGIAVEDARIAFENHATSKITTGDDLFNLSTLGFRGEALPSIAAVSKVIMTTRQSGVDTGIKVVNHGGTIQSITEVGCPEGTTIQMNELFYNTPARLGFLKKSNIEAGYVSDMLMRMILANPHVSIRLISNTKTIYHSPGDGDIRHAAMSIYGREAASKLIQVDATEGGLRVSGLIGVGDNARQNRTHQSFFINNRVVRCLQLSQALEAACVQKVTIGSFPMCMLEISLPSKSVDVNVHPNKLEVRFRDEYPIKESVQRLIASVFQGEVVLGMDTPKVTMLPENKHIKVIPEPIGTAVELPIKPEIKSEPIIEPIQDEKLKTSSINFGQTNQTKWVLNESPFAKQRVQSANVTVEIPKVEAQQEELENKPASIAYKLVGTVFDTYIIVQHESKMLLIDQHAAHERLLYEKFKEMLANGNASQQLLVPIIVQVSYKERMLIEENMDALHAAGFELTEFGERDYKVSAVPHILGQPDVKPFFIALLEQGDFKGGAIERRRESVIQLACKKAIKAGDSLTDAEIHGLIATMLVTGAPPTCPHGRPVMEIITRLELEKKFKRVQ